jgi:hypothetical protein
MTKLVHCNGHVLEVREVGPVIFRLEASLGPIKLNGCFIVDDNVARAWVRQFAEAQRDPTLSASQETTS